MQEAATGMTPVTVYTADGQPRIAFVPITPKRRGISTPTENSARETPPPPFFSGGVPSRRGSVSNTVSSFDGSIDFGIDVK
mmetsp:Transcript_70900/g.63668  ORF Transcript_70900/g.63668 Transcript_70900/m.63668 type:complete len:81 (-) Transcript_70900:44-286(-)